MAARIVKCKVCGQAFDMNKIQGVEAGARRFAHQSCMPDGKIVPLPPPKEVSSDTQELNKLKDYINKKFNGQVNWALVIKQITTMKNKKHFTYNGMLGTLVYIFEIEKMPMTDKMHGVGIIEYKYEEAKNYYMKLDKIKADNDKIDVNEINKTIEVVIKSPRPKFVGVRKLFKFLDD